jgi:hypothetical protein
MPDKLEALAILLVLLPGFSSAYIIRFLTIRREQSELDKVVEALLFSLVFFLITLPCFQHKMPIWWEQFDPASESSTYSSPSQPSKAAIPPAPATAQLKAPPGANTQPVPAPKQPAAPAASRPDQVAPGAADYRIHVDYWHVFWLFVLSLVFAVVYSANINREWMMRFFRWIKVTEHASQSTVWNSAFFRIGGYIQVRFTDGRNIIGLVREYSDDETDPCLLLEDAAWVGEDDAEKATELPIQGPILITKEMKIECVIFLPEEISVDVDVDDLEASNDEAPHDEPKSHSNAANLPG